MPAARRLLRIAHRGASGHRPENTGSALVHALELGADMVEIDCQLTRDGAAVILHDDTLERTTNGRGRVRDRTLAELRTLDAGSWFDREFTGEPLLTLEEAVGILKGRAGLNLELKGEDDPGQLERLALGVLASYRFLGKTVFSSFAPVRMRILRELSTQARIGILLDAGTSWADGLALAAELGAEALHPEKSLVRAERVAEAHRRGLEVRVWPVNRPRDIARLVALGVDGIFTDYPERLTDTPPADVP